MIALIDGVGDVGNADAVADLPHPGGAGAQLVHGGAVGALAHGADDRAAGDENLIAGLVLADQTLAGDAQAISTTSALPEAMISSIWAGSFRPPMVATGLETCFLISAASQTLSPWGANMGRWVRKKPNW